MVAILGMEPESLLIIGGAVFIFVLLTYLIANAIIRKGDQRTRLRLEELENEKLKMGMLFKKQLRKELKDAGLFLTNDEMNHVHGLKLDNSILSRKILYKMTEMEEKTKRLELGVNKARLENKLDQIAEHERELFS